MKHIVALFLLLSLPAVAQEIKPIETTPTPEVTVAVVPVAPSAEAHALVGYDKGFFIQSADERFRIIMTGYFQGYFEGRRVEAGQSTDTFRIRRGRLKWSGYVYNKDIQFDLEYDFPASRLLEAAVTLVASDKFKFRAGQFHVPFTLEQMSSSSTLQFVDRSIIQPYFGILDEREPGAGFNGQLFDKKLEYNVGVFNGEGPNTTNQNNEFRYAGRLVYNLAGKHGTEFADYKISKDPQVALGLGGMFNDTPDATTIPAGGTVALAEKQVSTVVGDLSVKYLGFSMHGEVLHQHTNPDAAISFNEKAWMEQMGYMITSKFEIAERVAQILPEFTHNQAEYTLGLNYYLHEGHRVKFQMDYSALTEQDGIAIGNDRLDHRVRAQFQVRL